MSLTKSEIESNFDAFTNRWKIELPDAINSLEIYRSEFLRSYSRIVTINAWRSNVLDGRISGASLAFFEEALNDAMVSHVSARFGSWRTALTSLRSCIENTCYCLYYKDHPVELKLWELGKHRPGFSEVFTYLKQHPDIAQLGETPVTGLAMIKKEYATLSRAVHASAIDFRMAANDVFKTTLWKPDRVRLGKWRSREQQTLCGLNLLMTATFRAELKGGQQASLRGVLSLVIPATLHRQVKKDLDVRILSI